MKRAYGGMTDGSKLMGAFTNARRFANGVLFTDPRLWVLINIFTLYIVAMMGMKLVDQWQTWKSDTAPKSK
jgi:hypothetical protein